MKFQHHLALETADAAGLVEPTYLMVEFGIAEGCRLLTDANQAPEAKWVAHLVAQRQIQLTTSNGTPFSGVSVVISGDELRFVGILDDLDGHPKMAQSETIWLIEIEEFVHGAKAFAVS